MEKKESNGDEIGWQFVYIRNVDFSRVHKAIGRVWDELQIDATKVAYSGSVGEYTEEFIVQCSYVEQFVTKFQTANALNPSTTLNSSSHLVAQDSEYSPIAPHLRYLPQARVSAQVLNALDQYARESLLRRWSRIYFTAEQPAVRKLVHESLLAYGLSPQPTASTRSCNSPLHYSSTEAVNVARQWAPNHAILSPDHLAELIPKPSSTRLVIYADGAYLHDRKRAGIGVYFENSSIEPLACPLPGHQSAARAEVYAVHMALERLKMSGAKICENEIWICTDSQYVVDGVNMHRETWQQANWLTAKGKPIANRTVFEMLFSSIKWFSNYGFAVFVHHLPAHAGIAGNEAADVLAKAGALLQVKRDQDVQF
ncbi:Ribonuclease H1 [Coemansia brasiliensis]|uniref:ribonuclease H n=1 Tax=Coemansia brasiliensis TaxID=2650707 RepID=A0A9W8M0B3_9FUNG|nr:Ribonuclease H1 [Coemansia brasiliensis]